METEDPRITQWRNRSFSWSQYSSFSYSYQQWFDKYILGKEQETTPQLRFGKDFAKAVEDNTHTAPVLRYSHVEHEIRVNHPDGFPMVGVFDSWSPSTLELGELKTGVKPWTQKRVDEHGQLTYYAMMLYLKDKIKPEDIKMTLQWLPTGFHGDFSYDFTNKENPLIHSFETRRTMLEVLELLSDIKTARKNMEKYALQRLKEI